MSECPHCKKEIGSSDWGIVKQQIARSKIFRINWKDLFGKSLTKLVAGYYAKGFNSTQTFLELSDILAMKGIVNRKYYQNLKIGVSARFAEIRSESKEIKRLS